MRECYLKRGECILKITPWLLVVCTAKIILLKCSDLRLTKEQLIFPTNIFENEIN